MTMTELQTETNNSSSQESKIEQSKLPIELMQLQEEFFKRLGGMGRSRNTLKNYRTDLDCFNHYLRETQKKLDISHFGQEEIIEYGNYLQAKYSSDNSRRRRVQALRIFFDFLIEKNLFPSNPVRKLQTSPKFLDIPRPTPLVDVKTLWNYLLSEAKNNTEMSKLLTYRNLVTLLLIYGGGLKVSDLTNLKTEHISLTVPPRVLILADRRDPYTVELPPVFTAVFSEYRRLLEEMKAKSKMEFDHLLFNANPYRILAGGLSARGLEVIFEEFRKKLIITLTPKSLRQACIFKWIHQGKNDSLIKEWMGVAPSYGLKLYKEHAPKNYYNEDFLEEIYSEVLGARN